MRTWVPGSSESRGTPLPQTPPQHKLNGYQALLVDEDEPIELQAWPVMESPAMRGIAGRIARLATENSEADPVAVLITVLVWAAAEFGRGQHTMIGDTEHHSRHFAAIVGNSSRARKGTSEAPVRRIFKRAEDFRLEASTLPFPSGSKLHVVGGPLSSGEGLVAAVRDDVEDENGECVAKGVDDKRLLVVEQELAVALRMFQRTGNNLSMILRMAYDGDKIQPLTKNDKVSATGSHINLIGHITRVELKALLTESEIFNGLANRFLWLMARRPRLVPLPKRMPDDAVDEVAREIAKVITLAHSRPSRTLVMSNSAQDHWCTVYPELTQDYPGILGAITSRQEAHARRLALTYAQLDGADYIEIHHLEAALALCRYSFDTCRYLFGEADLDPDVRKIIEALTPEKKLTTTEIRREAFSGHIKKERLRAVLQGMQDQGRVTMREEPTEGRPRQIWSLR